MADLHSKNAGILWAAAKFQTRIAASAALLFVAIFDARAMAAFTDPAPNAPARIVSLIPAITETLFAIGAGSRVVGVSTYCDFPSEAARLPKVGTFTEPVAETIVSLRPDLVLTSPSPGNETTVRAIERSGVRVAVVQSEGGLAEARAAMLEVSRQAGDEPAGLRLLKDIDLRLEALRARAATLPHPLAAIVVGREPLVLAGPASYLGELLLLAGGRNVVGGIEGRWPRIGMEFLVVARPDVIVDLSASMVGESSEAAQKEAVAAWSAFSSLPAVATGRVVADRATLMLRPGPRLAEAAEALFVALHPGAASPLRPASASLPVPPVTE